MDIIIKLCVAWKYEPGAYKLGNTTYIPDFLINNYILWEIKGYLSTLSERKLIQFAASYNIPLRMIFKEDIEQLESDVNKGVPIDVMKVGKDIMTVPTEFLSRFSKLSKKQLTNISNITPPNLMEFPLLIYKPI